MFKHYYLVPQVRELNGFGYPVYATDYRTSTHETRVLPITVPNYHNAYRCPKPNNTYRNHEIHVISAHTKHGIQRWQHKLDHKYGLYSTRVIHA